MSRLSDRLDRLEMKLQRDEVKHIFITKAEPDAPPVSGWECLQTGVRVERMECETDEALQARAAAADDEARRNGAAYEWPISLFLSWGDGWGH